VKPYNVTNQSSAPTQSAEHDRTRARHTPDVWCASRNERQFLSRHEQEMCLWLTINFRCNMEFLTHSHTP
jgi:hypothetical protein